MYRDPLAGPIRLVSACGATIGNWIMRTKLIDNSYIYIFDRFIAYYSHAGVQ